MSASHCIAEPYDAIVVGNGFAGVVGALSLTRQAALRGVALRVALIGPDSAQFFTPGLYEAIESDDPTLASISLPGRLPRSVEYIEGTGRLEAMPSMASGAWQVRVESPPFASRLLRASHVLLATGALRGRSKSLDPLTSWNDWLQLRGRLRAARSVIVVGGGVSGVELAASLRSALPSPSVRVTLVERNETILMGLPEAFTRACRSILQELGVAIITGRTADLPDADVSLDARGPWNEASRLETLLGPAYAPISHQGGFEADTLRVRVMPTQRVPAEEGLWALGDLAHLPGTASSAQAATQLAHQWAATVLRVRAGERPFKARVLDLGLVLRLGPHHAVGLVRVPGLGPRVVTGAVAQGLKATVRAKYFAELALAGRRLV
jgi:NADH dehydrogenase FAD-containing subunit